MKSKPNSEELQTLKARPLKHVDFDWFKVLRRVMKDVKPRSMDSIAKTSGFLCNQIARAAYRMTRERAGDFEGEKKDLPTPDEIAIRLDRETKPSLTTGDYSEYLDLAYHVGHLWYVELSKNARVCDSIDLGEMDGLRQSLTREWMSVYLESVECMRRIDVTIRHYFDEESFHTWIDKKRTMSRSKKFAVKSSKASSHSSEEQSMNAEKLIVKSDESVTVKKQLDAISSGVSLKASSHSSEEQSMNVEKLIFKSDESVTVVGKKHLDAIFSGASSKAFSHSSEEQSMNVEKLIVKSDESVTVVGEKHLDAISSSKIMANWTGLSLPATPPNSPSSSPESSPRIKVSNTQSFENDCDGKSSPTMHRVLMNDSFEDDEFVFLTPPPSESTLDDPLSSTSSPSLPELEPFDVRSFKNCYSNEEPRLASQVQFSSALKHFNCRVLPKPEKNLDLWQPATMDVTEHCPYATDILKTRNGNNTALDNLLRSLVNSEYGPTDQSKGKSKLFGTWTDIAPEPTQANRCGVDAFGYGLPIGLGQILSV